MNFKYLFGPVPSRRLGRSLGVDLVPHKTCTLNCVYCECGRTTCLTLKRDRLIPAAECKHELDIVLSQSPKLDYITFSGSGEPTLNSDIGEIIRFIKAEHPQYKIALLTNGTLLDKPEVVEQLLDADLVVASLDAASDEVFSRINRPHPNLHINQIIEGLAFFREQFDNLFWIEVFILPDVNDHESELKRIRNALTIIQPDKIQLNTLDRPGTENWVKPADTDRLTDIAEYLDGAEVISHGLNRPVEFDEPDREAAEVDETAQSDPVQLNNITQLLLSTIKRRPCTARDMAQVLGLDIDVVDRYLLELVEKGEIGKDKLERGIFYTARA